MMNLMEIDSESGDNQNCPCPKQLNVTGQNHKFCKGTGCRCRDHEHFIFIKKGSLSSYLF